MKKPTGCFIKGSPFLVGVPDPKPTETKGPWLIPHTQEEEEK